MGKELENVSAFMKKFHMTDPGEKILIGLSGGADSVCLFFVLLALKEQLGIELEAVHVNHCLRESADRDELFVSNLCAEKEIVLHTYKVDVAARAESEGLSTEEAARNARYECFEDAMKKSGAVKVAVAHHKNDCAETMLFHLGRGTGLQGMTGIRPVRDRIIRPLLCLEKSEIEAYLSECGQAYMIDETNASSEYSRNRMRMEVLPVLSDICPGAVEHIACAGEVLTEATDYLKEQTEAAFEGCVSVADKETGVLHLSLEKLSVLHSYLQKEVVRECLFRVAGSRRDIGRVHVETVCGLASLQVGRKVSLPYGVEVEKSYDVLLFRKCDAKRETGDTDDTAFYREVSLDESGQEAEISLPDGKMMRMRVFSYDANCEIPSKPYTKWLDYDKIKKPLVVRNVSDSDFFYFDDKNRKYVKDYMVNEKIPRTQRAGSIVVAQGNHMLYFVGKRISNAALVDDKTKRILEITVTGG